MIESVTATETVICSNEFVCEVALNCVHYKLVLQAIYNVLSGINNQEEAYISERNENHKLLKTQSY